MKFNWIITYVTIFVPQCHSSVLTDFLKFSTWVGSSFSFKSFSAIKFRSTTNCSATYLQCVVGFFICGLKLPIRELYLLTSGQVRLSLLPHHLPYYFPLLFQVPATQIFLPFLLKSFNPLGAVSSAVFCTRSTSPPLAARLDFLTETDWSSLST